MVKLLTAICFFSPKDNQPPLKYRNIKDEGKFINFVEKKGVLYINFYDKESKAFIKRHWLKQFR